MKMRMLKIAFRRAKGVWGNKPMTINSGRPRFSSSNSVILHPNGFILHPNGLILNPNGSPMLFDNPISFQKPHFFSESILWILKGMTGWVHWSNSSTQFAHHSSQPRPHLQYWARPLPGITVIWTCGIYSWHSWAWSAPTPASTPPMITTIIFPPTML